MPIKIDRGFGNGIKLKYSLLSRDRLADMVLQNNHKILRDYLLGDPDLMEVLQKYPEIHKLLQTNPIVQQLKSDAGYTDLLHLQQHDMRNTFREGAASRMASSSPIRASSPIQSGSSNSGCFIATAAYGSVLCKEVEYLRFFRDQYLLKRKFGRKFIWIYSEYSSGLASYI